MKIFEEQQYEFAGRHIGPNEGEINQMLQAICVDSLKELIDQTVPPPIRLTKPLDLPVAQTEFEYFYLDFVRFNKKERNI
jgi:glycine dehydrogenase